MWKTVLAVWGSTAMAIGIALYYTHNIRCLWFLLIPACMSFRSNDKEESGNDKWTQERANEMFREIEQERQECINEHDEYGLVVLDNVMKIMNKYVKGKEEHDEMSEV